MAGFCAPGNDEIYYKRLEQLKEAGATIVNITKPLLYSDEIQNAYGWYVQSPLHVYCFVESNCNLVRL